MIIAIPKQSFVALVREFVTSHCSSHDLAAMTSKRIAAEWVAAKEASGVPVPARVITSRSCARAFRALFGALFGEVFGAVSAVCNFATIRRRARMFGLQHFTESKRRRISCCAESTNTSERTI